MENIMQIILLAIIGLIIKLLGKIYFPKIKRDLNLIRIFFKGTGPVKLSKKERRELQMKYLIVLFRSFLSFTLGITGHFFFTTNSNDLNLYFYLIMEIISLLLILFCLILFIESIRIREKFENTGFWW
jgi:hypothetical protein